MGIDPAPRPPRVVQSYFGPVPGPKRIVPTSIERHVVDDQGETVEYFSNEFPRGTVVRVPGGTQVGAKTRLVPASDDSGDWLLTPVGDDTPPAPVVHSPSAPACRDCRWSGYHAAPAFSGGRDVVKCYHPMLSTRHWSPVSGASYSHPWMSNARDADPMCGPRGDLFDPFLTEWQRFKRAVARFVYDYLCW